MLCEFWPRHLGNTVSDWKIKNSWTEPQWLCFSTSGYPWRRSELHWWLLLRQRWLQPFVQFCWTSPPWQTPAVLSQSSHQSCGTARAPAEGKSTEKMVLCFPLLSRPTEKSQMQSRAVRWGFVHVFERIQRWEHGIFSHKLLNFSLSCCTHNLTVGDIYNYL